MPPLFLKERMRVLFEVRIMLFQDNLGWKFMFLVKIGKYQKSLRWLIKEVVRVEEYVPNNTLKLEDPMMLCENPEDFINRKVIQPEDM